MAQPSITVFGDPIATCTMRVELTLKLLDVPYEMSYIDLMSGAHKHPDHLARQPFGKVPALHDKETGVTLFESRCLMRYVASKAGGQLYGESNIAKRAIIDNWMEVESNCYNKPVSTIVYERYFKPVYFKGVEDVAASAAAEKELETVLDVYESHLGRNKFLAGNEISLADVSHVPYTMVLLDKTTCRSMYESRPNVWRWWTSMKHLVDMIGA